MADAQAPRCRAITKGGKPCGGTPVPGEDRCPWHSPTWAERRRQWSAKGGKGKSNAARAKKQLPAEPMTTEELHAWLGLVFKRVVAGRMEPGVGNAAANLARAICTVHAAGELEARVAALENEAALGRGETA